jgi:hypothetical protein
MSSFAKYYYSPDKTSAVLIVLLVWELLSSPYVPNMNVSNGSVCSIPALATIRGAAMVGDRWICESRDCLREDFFIKFASWKFRAFLGS